ncbi:hypothetical protein PF003_g351 [Phytophthora fragariae]|nr:hypothetical protein PF003_g351 [Phytophthora fragariae]
MDGEGPGLLDEYPPPPTTKSRAGASCMGKAAESKK